MGLPSLLYSTSGSSPGFGLYFSASIPAGKNNANGSIPYQLVPIITTTDTTISLPSKHARDNSISL